MFWTHLIDRTINQANLNGSNPTVIVANFSAYIPGESFFHVRHSVMLKYCASTGGLAVDWINYKVYFSYESDTNSHIAVYDITTGEYSDVLTSSSHSVYYDIAVDPFDQLVYSYL